MQSASSVSCPFEEESVRLASQRAAMEGSESSPLQCASILRTASPSSSGFPPLLSVLLLSEEPAAMTAGLPPPPPSSSSSPPPPLSSGLAPADAFNAKNPGPPMMTMMNGPAGGGRLAGAPGGVGSLPSSSPPSGPFGYQANGKKVEGRSGGASGAGDVASFVLRV